MIIEESSMYFDKKLLKQIFVIKNLDHDHIIYDK